MTNYYQCDPMGCYYKHKYGGIYQTICRAKLAATGERVIVYRHVWPFDEETFVRPEVEFTSERFDDISLVAVENMLFGDRKQQQELVQAAKRIAELARGT